MPNPWWPQPSDSNKWQTHCREGGKRQTLATHRDKTLPLNTLETTLERKKRKKIRFLAKEIWHKTCLSSGKFD